MSCSIPPLLLTLLFALLSLPSTTSLPISTGWIKDACNYDRRPFDTPFCILLLQSIPEVSSNKDLVGFLFSIMHVGTRYAAFVRSNIDQALEKADSPALNNTLHACKTEYDEAILKFDSALHESLMHAYDNAAQNLLSAGKSAYPCEKAMVDNGVEIGFLLTGNKNVKVFGIAGYNTAKGMW